MFKEEINGKEFEFNCKLKTCVAIRKRFKKTFNQIVKEMEALGEDELAIFLYVGIVDPKMTEAEFVDHILEGEMGMGDLIDLVVKYTKQLQYPGLTEEEIEKKLLAKKEEADKYQLEA